MDKFERIASLIIALYALYQGVEVIAEYLKVRKEMRSPWRGWKLTHVNPTFLGLQLGSFKCTSEYAVLNWGYFLSLVRYGSYCAIMWGIVKLIVFKFS